VISDLDFKMLYNLFHRELNPPFLPKNFAKVERVKDKKEGCWVLKFKIGTRKFGFNQKLELLYSESDITKAEKLVPVKSKTYKDLLKRRKK